MVEPDVCGSSVCERRAIPPPATANPVSPTPRITVRREIPLASSGTPGEERRACGVAWLGGVPITGGCTDWLGERSPLAGEGSFPVDVHPLVGSDVWFDGACDGANWPDEGANWVGRDNWLDGGTIRGG